MILFTSQSIDEAYMNVTSEDDRTLYIYLLSQNCVGCPYKLMPVEQVGYNFIFFNLARGAMRNG